MADRGDYMTTYTGKRFYPLDPQPEDFDIEDIARALSNTCRYSGHVREFYSVAQHCVLCCYQAAPRDALEALLHDRSEAYLSDLVTPAKYALPDYRGMEEHLEEVSAPTFKIRHPMPPEIKMIDRKMLVTEARVLLPNCEPWWENEKYPEPYNIDILPWTPRVAYQAFMEAYNEYRRDY